MKREDVSKIFENATEEQISKLLDINSADIGAAKKKLEAERDNDFLKKCKSDNEVSA